MVNSKTVTTGGIGSTTANFTVDLEKPGSSAIYDLTVENKGTVDAILKSIEGIDESNLSEPLDIKYSIIGIEEGESLNVGATKSFQVKVVWSSSATSVPTSSKSLVLKLNYEQNTGSGIVATPEEFFEIDDSGVITRYTGDETDIVIPSTINGISVTKIGSMSFFSKSLTSVVIPKGVTEIDNMAFMSAQLTSAVIPSTVKHIGSQAFAYNQLTSVVLSEGLESIDESAFIQNKLASIEIPKSVTNIGGSAFSQNQLTSVKIPKGVTSIGSQAFYANQLTNVVLSEGIENIGESAFKENKLTSVEIPSSVKNIYSWAFYENQLTNVVLSEGLENIGQSAFENNQLTNVVIPSSVISIDNYSFNNNSPLTKIVNKTGKPFDWSRIVGQGSGSSAIAGTYGNVTVTTE